MIVKSLKAQLILITLLPMLITLIFVSALTLQEYVGGFEEELDTKAQDIATQITMLSEFYLYSEDIDSLKHVSETLMRTQPLQYVRFVSVTGHELVMTSSNETKSPYHGYSFPIYSTQTNLDVLDEGDEPTPLILGLLEIGLYEKESIERRSQAFQRILLISLSSLLLGIFLVGIVTRTMNKNITNLSSTAKSIHNGDYQARCEENGSGELRELQQIFNSMATSFEKNELQMQTKIDAATDTLSKTINLLTVKNKELDQSRQETITLERTKAISDERERIMKDMHDGIGGQLVASLALLEQEPDSPLKTNINQILMDCLEDLRLIINSLNVTNESLSSLLVDFKFGLNKKLDPLNIRLLWQLDEQVEQVHILPQTNIHLLRILQEAFTNILKHANASEVQFSVLHHTHYVEINIIDNGQFNPSKLNNNGHGINNMYSRAKLIGADFSIGQANSGGCHLTLRLPHPK